MSQIAKILPNRRSESLSQSLITNPMTSFEEKDRIILRCPKHDKEFTLDQLNSSRCPYCKEWIDVYTLILLKNSEFKNEAKYSDIQTFVVSQ